MGVVKRRWSRGGGARVDNLTHIFDAVNGKMGDKHAPD